VEIGSKEWHNIILKSARSLDVCLNSHHIHQFASHAGELIKWNRKFNLTRITDPVDLAIKHFVDSIVPAQGIEAGTSVLDMGTGGGFPGIPLKILNPSISVTLIDASRKKTTFLKHVIRKLKLENIDAIHVRAEDLGQESTFAHRFDTIISRALSNLDTFVSLALPMLAAGGKVIALKGKFNPNEIDTIFDIVKKERLSMHVKKYMLPHFESERTIIRLSAPDTIHS